MMIFETACVVYADDTVVFGNHEHRNLSQTFFMKK